MVARLSLVALLLAGVRSPLLAQEAPAPPPTVEPSPAEAATTAEASADEYADGEEDIVVSGQRERGAVVGDIRPEVQLTPADIRSYGVNSVAELLEELGPQTRSGRGEGAPVTLLNGLRISGFSEIRDIPTEAIQRVDILPEEVALKYGFTANQKVVNIVLRRRFRATTVELSDRIATDGGANSPEAEIDYLRITPDGRFSLSAEYERQLQLREDQRDLAEADPFRTLLPATEEASLNAVYATSISEGVSATINGRAQYDDSRSLQGLGADGSLITQNNDSLNTRLATTLNGAISGWQWTFTGNYDRTETETTTSVVADRARSVVSLFGGDFTINGQPLDLPAGAVSTTLRLNASSSDFESRSVRDGISRRGDVQRDIGGGQINVDVPIASRGDFLGFLGDLSLNGNVEVQRLSDFGTLYSYGAGTTWSPIRALNLVASFTDEDNAPTAQQLGNPVIVTPGIRVFDLVRGQDAIVTQISGGNPDLLANSRRVWRLQGTLRPFGETDLSLVATYTNTRTRNGIFNLGFPTAQLQTAFPDRFIRDGTGDLIQIDTRPVNFFREDREQLRWGVNFSKRIQDSTAEQFRALAAAGRLPFPGRGPGAAGRSEGVGGDRPRGAGRGGGRFGGGGFGGGGGRLQLALYHTWTLKDEVLVRPGGPLIDRLDGGTLGRGGGTPRHQIEVQAGVTRNGLGIRTSINWQSGTTVEGATGLASDRLQFSDLATVDLRLFANLGNMPKLVVDNPWLRGTRVTLSVDNLFDARQRVRDATGTTPVNYQPDLLDPLGRTVRLSLRKLFFARPQRRIDQPAPQGQE
jgi:uncharacterized membrane protein YgcG